MKKLFAVVFIFVAFTLIRQQGEINDYNDKIDNINNQIAEQEAFGEELAKKDELYSSEGYIEEVAREELGLVMADEKIFVDANSK